MSNGLLPLNSSRDSVNTTAAKSPSDIHANETLGKTVPASCPIGQELRTASMPNLRRVITEDERRFAPSFLLDELFHGLVKKS